MVSISVFSFLFVYVLQRLQGHLPLNPMHFSTPKAPSFATPMTPDLEFRRILVERGMRTVAGCAEKQRRRMVGARGFEPPTPCAQGRCATRLRYAPTL